MCTQLLHLRLKEYCTAGSKKILRARGAECVPHSQCLDKMARSHLNNGNIDILMKRERSHEILPLDKKLQTANDC